MVFTVMLALATASLLGTLSTSVFTVAVPPVPLEVNVAVAVPDACMVNCCALRVPKVAGPQVTVRPISLSRLAAGIAVPAELERKPVVTVAVFPKPAAVLQIVLGDADVFNCSHGVVVSTPAPPAPTIAALLHAPAVVGSVLQPHQLLVAFTLPDELFLPRPLVAVVVDEVALLKNRL